MTRLHPTLAAVTDRVIEWSGPIRRRYLDLLDRERDGAVKRPQLGCANLAHAYAGTAESRDAMRADRGVNIGVVTAYNDMLSANAVYCRYPERMKVWAREAGETVQVAGATPAMCDGVTQGYPGMELSLFSRDVIALSTAVALSHGTFEAAALLGIRDKIVPGLLMGALRFGHLPVILIPDGPMPSGLANRVKAGVREAYATRPTLDEAGALGWKLVGESGDDTILHAIDRPFSPDGGMRILQGNLGRACIKVSAVERERWVVEAPARVFDDQGQVLDAFKAGELERDVVVVVVRYQGPRANGMPELHKLTPPLGVLQNRGFRVALVTDGRMSGASGKVPCAIHCSPEALGGGPLGRVRDGNMVRVDAEAGTLDALVAEEVWLGRDFARAPPEAEGMGRELLNLFRGAADEAELGASAMLSGVGL